MSDSTPSTSSLKEELAVLRTRLEAGLPPEAVATMHRAVDELRASDAIDRQGTIRAAESDPDYTTRPEPRDTLEVLRAIVR